MNPLIAARRLDWAGLAISSDVAAMPPAMVAHAPAGILLMPGCYTTGWRVGVVSRVVRESES